MHFALQIPSKDGCSRVLSDVLEFLLDLPENRPLLNTKKQTIRVTLHFACDDAKVTKCKDSVRGVCKIIYLVNMGRFNRTDSPDDELTVFLYMGKNA